MITCKRRFKPVSAPLAQQHNARIHTMWFISLPILCRLKNSSFNKQTRTDAVKMDHVHIALFEMVCNEPPTSKPCGNCVPRQQMLVHWRHDNLINQFRVFLINTKTVSMGKFRYTSIYIMAEAHWLTFYLQYGKMISNNLRMMADRCWRIESTGTGRNETGRMTTLLSIESFILYIKTVTLPVCIQSLELIITYWQLWMKVTSSIQCMQISL